MLGPLEWKVEGEQEPAEMDLHTCVKYHGAVLSLALNPPSWSVGQNSGDRWDSIQTDFPL